jgi:hypothetical protein
MHALVLEFARLDRKAEPILRRRQWAGGEARERAGRIEGFVEIDVDAIRMG